MLAASGKRLHTQSIGVAAFQELAQRKKTQNVRDIRDNP